jgi:hypothetical protein
MKNYFFISSVHPDDVLTVVEAPDTTAGERNEPHWRVIQSIKKGDGMIFRDSLKKALVGVAIADWSEKGPHRHAPKMQALRWWLTDAIRFEQPIPDKQFQKMFVEHDDDAAGFKLFRSTGQFNQKTYAYPLTRGIAEAVLKAANVRAE